VLALGDGKRHIVQRHGAFALDGDILKFDEIRHFLLSYYSPARVRLVSKHLLMQAAPLRAKAPREKTAAGKSPAVAAGSRMPGEDRRRQLIDVAIQVFARNGFGGTKTKDIAAAAGVSEAIVFRHFASKEDLYHAILDAKEKEDASAEQLIARLQVYAALRDDAGLIECVARTALKSFRQDPAFHRLLLYARLEGHLLAGLFQERFGLPIGDFLRRYIVLRQEEGAFRNYDPQMAVMLTLGSIVHFAMGRYVFQARKPPVSEETAVHELVEFVLAGLTSGCGVRRVKDKNEKDKNEKEKEQHGHARK
jgi:TetR/AcrR family transcriptional regulator